MTEPNEKAGWESLFKSGIFPPRYQTFAAPNASVVDWAQTLPADASILDVGCGIGRHVVYLGERGFSMAGLDISPTAISTTQAICAERHIAFDGRVGLMTALPWPDEVFDAALANSAVNHHVLADIATVLAEIRRVLKPGGLLLVDFAHKDTRTYHRTRAQAAAGELIEVEPDTFVNQRPDIEPGEDDFLPHHFTDEAEARELLRDFELLDLRAEFFDLDENGVARRGRWIAQARKPTFR